MNNRGNRCRSWVIILLLIASLVVPDYVNAELSSVGQYLQETSIAAAGKKSKKKSKKESSSSEETTAKKKKSKKKETTSAEETTAKKKTKKETTSAEETTAKKKKKKNETTSVEEESTAKKKKKKKETTSADETAEPGTERPVDPETTAGGGEETTAKESDEEKPTEEKPTEESTAVPETSSEPEGSEADEEEEEEKEKEKEKEEEGSEEESGETSGEDGLERESEIVLPTETSSGKKDDSLETATVAVDHGTEDSSDGSGDFDGVIYPGFYEIVDVVIPNEYRFTKIDRVPVIVADGTKILTEKSGDAAAAGRAEGDALAFLIEDGEKWAFVEYGYVRGFVKKSSLTEGTAAKAFYKRFAAWKRENSGSSVKSPYGSVVQLMDHLDNPAFTYTLTTTMEVMASKIYAIAAEKVNIYDSRSWVELDLLAREGLAEKSEEKEKKHIAGILKKGDLAYVLLDEEDCLYIESGNVRGFVRKEALSTGLEVNRLVKDKGEYEMELAEEKLEPEKNRAFYYTVLSVIKTGTGLRETVVAFALQFVGNPYVWGGTSLTHGADCSGFIQSVYRHFGYHLPRTSAAMRRYGVNIGTDLKDALPGDIICYNGHVSMYIGGGKIVHASNSAAYPRGGIKVSKNGAYRKILTIRRVIR